MFCVFLHVKLEVHEDDFTRIIIHWNIQYPIMTYFRPLLYMVLYLSLTYPLPRPQNLPYIILTNEDIKRVLDLYMYAFTDMLHQPVIRR